jgi:hypothetical protein
MPLGPQRPHRIFRNSHQQMASFRKEGEHRDRGLLACQSRIVARCSVPEGVYTRHPKMAAVVSAPELTRGCMYTSLTLPAPSSEYTSAMALPFARLETRLYKERPSSTVCRLYVDRVWRNIFSSSGTSDSPFLDAGW